MLLLVIRIASRINIHPHPRHIHIDIALIFLRPTPFIIFVDHDVSIIDIVSIVILRGRSLDKRGLILKPGRGELEGKGVFEGLNRAFSNTNIFANADFDALVCERTRERCGFYRASVRKEGLSHEDGTGKRPSMPGNFFAVYT